MKNHLLSGSVAFIIMLFTMSSCEDALDTGYAGTWEVTISDGVSVKDKLVLTETTFEKVNSIKPDGEEEYVDAAIYKGDLEEADGKFTFTITSIGTDPQNSGTIVWVAEGDLAWDSTLTALEIENPVTVSYTVAVGTLTLTGSNAFPFILSDGVPMIYGKVN